MISVWEKETFYAPQDVIIAGSGFVGLWSAFYLKKKNPRLKITVIDRGIIPTGASTRNAGFACFGSLSELLADEQRMGSDEMLRLVEMRYKGLERIRKSFREKEIDMDMCGGYELFTKKTDRLSGDLREQIHYLNELLKPIVSKKTFRLSDRKIKSFGFTGISQIVDNKLEGYLHSGKLLNALLSRVRTMGVQVLSAIEIERFEKTTSGIDIHTREGIPLNTKKLLICINGFAKQLLPQLDVEPARGQVLVTSPIEGLPWKGTFHYEQGYYYFRNLGSRVLLGGARNLAMKEENTYSMETSPFIQRELERFLKETILPEKKFTIEYRWGGTMGVGHEKMPILQEVEPDVFCCVRMSGMGVALAPLLGERAAKLLRG